MHCLNRKEGFAKFMTRNRRYIKDIVWRQPTLLCQIGSKSSSHSLAQYPIGKRKKIKRRKIVRRQNVLQKQCKSSHILVAVNICNMAHGLCCLGREPQKKPLGALILQISQKKIKLSPFTLILV